MLADLFALLALATMDQLVEQLPYLGLVVLLVLGTLGFPFPEDGILLLLGVLIAKGAVEPVLAVALVYVVVLGTDVALYEAGHRFGRKVVEQRRFRRVVSPRTWERLERAYARWHFWVILAGRNLIGVRAQVFLAAGALGIRRWQFIAADAAAAAISLATWGGIGYLGAHGLSALAGDAKTLQWVLSLGVGLVFALAIAVLFWLGWRRGDRDAEGE